MELELREMIDRAMDADRHRLLRRLKEIERLPIESPRRLADWERLLHAAQASSDRRESRSAIQPKISFDPELPISAYCKEITRLLAERQVLVVCGETGSGKSTQLPKICLAAGRGRSAMIGHTQPRRLAASSIAARLADELETRVGEHVGFKIRFTDRSAPTTLVKLMTDGVLLAEVSRDRFLNAYDTIIIDEAHERSLNIDILLGYLKQLLPKRPELRVIITSATIDAERFAEHFGDEELGPAPVILVEGRTYPVEVRYRCTEDDRQISLESSQEDIHEFHQRLTNSVEELFLEGPGDILIFLPSQRDILDAAKVLRGFLTRHGLMQQTEVLPLYSRLTEAEQRKIFQPHSQRRIVLATNVAESSLTVPGIRYVIDSGTARISRYATRSKVQRLPIEPVARASADQRAGRCGRIGPGICIRLFSEQDYLSRPQFTTPEIRRANLAAVVLQTRLLGVGNPDELPLLDPPRPDVIRDAIQSLKELGAISPDGQLTDIGRQLGRWPVDPSVGRMLIEANKNGCLADCLIIASGLEVQDVRTRPAEHQQAADEAHAKFRDPHSDFLSLLRIWDFYHNLKEDLGRSQLQRACRQNFLSDVRLREWSDVHRQLAQLVKESGMHIGARTAKLGLVAATEEEGDGRAQARRRPKHQEPNPITKHPKPDSYALIHQSLLAGLITNIAQLDDNRIYKGTRNIDFQIWPGSGLKRHRPKWLMVAEIVETGQRYGRTVAGIEPTWIEPLAKDLLKFSYADPHFSREAGSAMVYERGTLAGLTVIPRRRVALARLDPANARRLLIDEGLSTGQLVSRAKFYQHNQELLAEVEAIAARTRDLTLVVDPFVLQQFYEDRLPEKVVDRASLEKWDKDLSFQTRNSKSTTELPPIYLRWHDLGFETESNELEKAFPDKLEIGEMQLPLTYHFEPGSELDGVAVRVPQEVVPHLNQQRLEWLVPGMLQPKILGLIKSLPKRLRRNMVPAADYAEKAIARLNERQLLENEFWPSICRILSELAEEPIRQSDFQIDKLPEHLRMRIEVIDDSGKLVSATRDLAEFLPGGTTNATPLTSQAIVDLSRETWYGEGLENLGEIPLPLSVVLPRGGVQVTVYPTWSEVDEKLNSIVCKRQSQADQILRKTVQWLLGRDDRKEIRSQTRNLPDWSRSQIRLQAICSSEKLTEGIQQLMVRAAFLEGEALPRSQAEYEALRANRMEKIFTTTQQIAKWLPKFAESFHQLKLAIEAPSTSSSKTLEYIGYQLDKLVSEGFLAETPWESLKEYPRYLQAMTVRLERVRTIGQAKDNELEQVILRFQSELQTLKDDASITDANLNSLEEIRWSLEELRVSLFAQQLGTKYSISTNRVEKAIAKLNPHHH